MPLNWELATKEAMDRKRVITAVLISPFASLVVVLMLAAESLLHDFRIVSVDGLVVTGLMALVFVSTSFVLVLVLGVPVHWALSKMKINGGIWYVVAGVSIAVAYQYLVSPEDAPPSHLQIGLWTHGVTAVFVSWCFWYLAARSPRK